MGPWHGLIQRGYSFGSEKLTAEPSRFKTELWTHKKNTVYLSIKNKLIKKLVFSKMT
jgi:hypothetical protein